LNLREKAKPYWAARAALLARSGATHFARRLRCLEQEFNLHRIKRELDSAAVRTAQNASR
jgi:hypothetical protein